MARRVNWTALGVHQWHRPSDLLLDDCEIVLSDLSADFTRDGTLDKYKEPVFLASLESSRFLRYREKCSSCWKCHLISSLKRFEFLINNTERSIMDAVSAEISTPPAPAQSIPSLLVERRATQRREFFVPKLQHILGFQYIMKQKSIHCISIVRKNFSIRVQKESDELLYTVIGRSLWSAISCKSKRLKYLLLCYFTRNSTRKQILSFRFIQFAVRFWKFVAQWHYFISFYNI